MNLTQWRDTVHASTTAAGWWDVDWNDAVSSANFCAAKIALLHSEVSEMLEGVRKGLPDDHLPHRSMTEVEAADVFIRLIDLCGALNLDIEGAVAEKLAYNQKRADHTRTARAGAGGKKF
jgi:NTP pyrophosphatase (non-canonical NTP hydrolase)